MPASLFVTTIHHIIRCFSFSQLTLTTHQLRSRYRIHLLQILRTRLRLSDRPHLIRRVPGYSNVILFLEHQLYVSQLQTTLTAQFGQLACTGDDVVDEFVGELKNGLRDITLVGDDVG